MIATSLVSLLAACNNSGETKSEIVTDSSTHEMNHSASQTNEMKGLMDKMMMQMHGVQATGNNDVDFATMMIVHHKGAVEMAKLELARGSNNELRKFAQAVIDAQEKEISFMGDFIARAPKTTSSDTKTFQDGLAASMKTMMEDSTRSYNDIDKDFAAQMIPHHQSAVDMAKVYLKLGTNEELKTLSRNIQDSQTGEIEMLRNWLEKVQ
jgi:uncharacterized protein (DUF305 family)